MAYTVPRESAPETIWDTNTTQEQLVTAYSGTDDLAFVDGGGSADTITRTVGSFVTDGFVAGMGAVVTSSTSSDGAYTIDAGGVAAQTLTLVAADVLPAHAAEAATLKGVPTPTIPAGTTAITFTAGDATPVLTWVTVNGGADGTGFRLDANQPQVTIGIDPLDLPTIDIFPDAAEGIINLTYFTG